MAQAYVMTTTELGLGDRRTLWVVLADSPTLAIETARTNGCHVDQIVGTLSEETVEHWKSCPGRQSFSKGGFSGGRDGRINPPSAWLCTAFNPANSELRDQGNGAFDLAPLSVCYARG